MIINKLSALRNYIGMNPHFEKVTAFFEANDIYTLADGTYEIDGRNAWVTIREHALKSEDEARREAHNSYLDIQILIAGAERYGWKARQDCCEVAEPMDSEKDIIFYADRATKFIDLTAGEMVIFCPDDVHAPLIGRGTVRKAIVKVAVDVGTDREHSEKR